MTSNSPRGNFFPLRNHWGSNISPGKTVITIVIYHLDCTSIYNKCVFYYVLFVIIAELCFSKKLNEFLCDILKHNFSLQTSTKALIAHTQQTLKYGSLSGVDRS